MFLSIANLSKFDLSIIGNTVVYIIPAFDMIFINMIFPSNSLSDRQKQ